MVVVVIVEVEDLIRLEGAAFSSSCTLRFLGLVLIVLLVVVAAAEVL